MLQILASRMSSIKLREVLLEHILLLEAHRVRAAQLDFAVVEEHPAARLARACPAGTCACRTGVSRCPRPCRRRRAGGPGSDRATAFPDPTGAVSGWGARP